MPQEIELPDGSIAEFPDDMGDDQIAAVLKKQFQAPDSPPSSASPAAAAPRPPDLPEASYGVMDVLRQVPASLPDAPKQFAKYGLGLLKGGARMASRGLDQVVSSPMGLPGGGDALTGLTGMDRQRRMSEIDSMLGLAPGDSAEKVGGVVAEALPYFVPGGAARGASRAATAAGRFIEGGAKMLLEGGRSAAISRGLQGSTPEESLMAGAIGAAGQGVTNAADALVPALKRSAIDLFQKAVKPTREHLKVAVERIAPEAVKRGIKGSLAEITGEAKGKRDAAEKLIRSTYDRATASGKRFDATAIADSIDDLKRQFNIVGQGGGTIRPQAEAALDAIKERVLAQGGPGVGISPRDLWETRKAIDEIIAGASGAGFDVKKAGVKGASDRVSTAARRLMQDKLNTIDPTRLPKMNEEFGFWSDLYKGAKSSATRGVGQESPLWSTLVGSGVGAAAGGIAGKDKESAGIGAVIGAAGGKKALDLMRTPAWRTTSAAVRDAVADLIKKGRVDDAVALLGRSARAGASISGGLGDE